MTSSLYHLDSSVKDFLRGLSDKNGKIDVNYVKKIQRNFLSAITQNQRSLMNINN